MTSVINYNKSRSRKEMAFVVLLMDGAKDGYTLSIFCTFHQICDVGGFFLVNDAICWRVSLSNTFIKRQLGYLVFMKFVNRTRSFTYSHLAKSLVSVLTITVRFSFFIFVGCPYNFSMKTSSFRSICNCCSNSFYIFPFPLTKDVWIY